MRFHAHRDEVGDRFSNNCFEAPVHSRGVAICEDRENADFNKGGIRPCLMGAWELWKLASAWE